MLSFYAATSEASLFFGSAAEPIRLSKVEDRRRAIGESQGRCVYLDQVTGRVCESRHQVQIDHVIPKALGGVDAYKNYRPLCRQHNLLMAEMVSLSRFPKNQIAVSFYN